MLLNSSTGLFLWYSRQMVSSLMNFTTLGAMETALSLTSLTSFSTWGPREETLGFLALGTKGNGLVSVLVW